jgi:capsular exopolysaccharide synthesis family protein
MSELGSRDATLLAAEIDVWKSYLGSLTAEESRLQASLTTTTQKGLNLEADREDLNIVTELTRRISSEVEAIQVETEAPARIQELARADVPQLRDEYRKMKAGGAFAFGAFGFALIGVSFWEFRARRVDSVEDVAAGLGLRLVGALPALPSRNRVASRSRKSVQNERWQNILIESVDATRTMLLHASRVENIHVVMVSSPVKGEGKSSLACHLAASLARAGRKTLLVDCDLRSPTLHRLLGLPLGPGLGELLRDEIGIDGAIVESMASSLDVITAGQCDDLAIQALAGDRLRALLSNLRNRYDFIIVDSSPVLPVADSLLVSQSVDAIIFSVLREVSRLPQIYSAYERFAALGVKTLGAVVNGVQNEVYSVPYGRDRIAKPHADQQS